MKVAVTGGGGRLGCAVVRQLLERGDRVRVLEPGQGTPASLRGLDVELVQGSVLSADAVAAFVEGVDLVIHIAAKINLDRDRDGSIQAINVDGTRLVAEACLARGLRMAHCSSHHALELKPFHLPHDENKPLALKDPCDYHRTKALGQELVQGMVRERGLNATIFNPGSMIGPQDYEPSLLGKALIDLYHRRIPALMEVVSDYVDARDVAAGAIAAAERGRTGECYLLTGIVHEMREFLDMWQAVSGVATPKVILPIWVGWVALPVTLATARLTGKPPLFSAGVLRAAVSSRVVLHDKARRELGFNPRPARESLADAFAFYQSQGWLDQARAA